MGTGCEVLVPSEGSNKFAGLVPPQDCDESLPAITGSYTYQGHFTDTRPELDAAGKLYSPQGSVKECLNPPPRPPSPELIRRFHGNCLPRHGASRVHYGQSYDAERAVARTLRHGVPTKSLWTAGELINPERVTNFTRHIIDHKDKSNYHSEQKKPVGRCRDTDKSLPTGLDPNIFTFGVWSQRDVCAGQLINPNRNPPEVDARANKGHDLYRMSHHDYDSAEQLSRNYLHPSFNARRCFGLPTPHDNAGSETYKSLKWIQYSEAQKAAPISTKVEDEFRERTHYQIGKTLDPMRDTLNVPLDHTFGKPIPWDPYGVGDLLHMRRENRFMRGRQHDLSLIAVVRNHLKKANFQSFDNLLHAFKFYDKDQKGRISIKDLYETCMQFNLPISCDLLVQLFDYCDHDHDSFINYVEFANFLNWKETMHSGFPKPCSPPCNLDLVDSNPVLLPKNVDCAYDDQRTSSSLINAAFGQISLESLRRYGVPSIRSDLHAPRIRRCDDNINYGDAADVWALIHPNVFSNHGVSEREVLAPRSSQELKEIFKKIGVDMDCETFNKLYHLAAQISPHGEVSVETFRSVLEMAQEDALHKYRDTLKYGLTYLKSNMK